MRAANTTTASPSRSPDELGHLSVPDIASMIRQIAPVSTAELQSCIRLQQEQGLRLEDAMVEMGLIDQQQVLEARTRRAQWAARLRSSDLAPNSFPMDTCVSVVFPCYNEAAAVGSTIESALAILPEFVHDFELVVVDDGSVDQTAEIVRRYAKKDERVRLVQHPRNRGYGAAVSTGFRAATGDWVCLNDGDGQFSLVDLPNLLVETVHADVVFGYRHQRADKPVRILNAKLWNLLVAAVLGVKIRDLDCAFKLIPKWVIDQIDLSSDGACISAEMVTQIVRGGLKVAEVPVNHYPRFHGDATGARLEVIGKAFRELPTLWKHRKTPKIVRGTSARAENNGKHERPSSQELAAVKAGEPS